MHCSETCDPNDPLCFDGQLTVAGRSSSTLPLYWPLNGQVVSSFHASVVTSADIGTGPPMQNCDMRQREHSAWMVDLLASWGVLWSSTLTTQVICERSQVYRVVRSQQQLCVARLGRKIDGLPIQSNPLSSIGVGHHRGQSSAHPGTSWPRWTGLNMIPSL